MAKARVLVVDDDPITLEAIRDRLARAGYDVAIRDQALGTSTWIIANRPDVVLLDVMMPALSGHDLASLLKKRGVETAVILHSSKEASELSRLARDVGAAGAIQKTGDGAAFLREFERIVEDARDSRT